MKLYIFTITKNWSRYCRLAQLSFLVFILFLYGCNKFVEIDPPKTSLTGSAVFANNKSANAAVANIYILMSRSALASGTGSISVRMGLYSDELNYYQGSSSDVTFSQFFNNKLVADQQYYFWIEIFKIIYEANNVIQALEKSQSITAALKNQLIGEAKFLRGFIYFYAVNLYGDLPLVLTTDYKINNVISRSPASVVLKQIINDLKDAKSLLGNDYLNGSEVTTERTRANSSCASALLARVYLYNKDWKDAENESSLVIANSLYSLQGLSDIFKKNSNESILQLESVTTLVNTFDAYYFVLTSKPSLRTCPVALSSSLMDAFEANDLRREKWVGTFTDTTVKPNVNYYFPFKYKVYKPFSPVTEFLTVFRLSEQYLIRAEARVQQDNINGSTNDLNTVRNRSGLSNTAADEKSSILEAIIHERKVELFTEWGHRWFDLKRNENFESIMSTIASQKNTTWASEFQVLPIPNAEILKNSNLTQNKGY
jgi:starch-binding outer membrane protein, SusD/RagB family